MGEYGLIVRFIELFAPYNKDNKSSRGLFRKGENTMHDDFWETLISDTPEGDELRSIVFDDDEDEDIPDFSRKHSALRPASTSRRPQNEPPLTEEEKLHNLEITMKSLLYIIARTFFIYLGITIVIMLLYAFSQAMR